MILSDLEILTDGAVKNNLKILMTLEDSNDPSFERYI